MYEKAGNIEVTLRSTGSPLLSTSAYVDRPARASVRARGDDDDDDVDDNELLLAASSFFFFSRFFDECLTANSTAPATAACSGINECSFAAKYLFAKSQLLKLEHYVGQHIAHFQLLLLLLPLLHYVINFVRARTHTHSL